MQLIGSLDGLQAVCTGVSIIGALFVMKKEIIGQWLWLYSNVGWLVFSIFSGLYFQAFLWLVYIVITIFSIIEWSKKKHD